MLQNPVWAGRWVDGWAGMVDSDSMDRSFPGQYSAIIAYTCMKYGTHIYCLYGASVSFNGVIDSYQILFFLEIWKKLQFLSHFQWFFGPVLSHYCMYVYGIWHNYHPYGTVMPLNGLIDKGRIFFYYSEKKEKNK